MEAKQIFVRRKDGMALLCENVNAFEDRRTGPLILGIDGSVALYITHQRGPDDNDWEELEDVVDPEWGGKMTYIPASEITFIELRNK